MTEIRQAVTTSNLRDLSFMEMLDALEPYVLEDIPEGIQQNPERGEEVDRLLGRFANLYSYLMYLHSFASYEADRQKIIGGQSDSWKVWVRKKDALFELAKSIRMKWKACSRMLTGLIQAEESLFDRVDYQSRQEKARGNNDDDDLPFPKLDDPNDARSHRKSDMKGWNTVS